MIPCGRGGDHATCRLGCGFGLAVIRFIVAVILVIRGVIVVVIIIVVIVIFGISVGVIALIVILVFNRGSGFFSRLLEKSFAVFGRKLVVIGMDFAECEKPVTIAAILDESCLQRWFDPRYLCEIDIAAKLFVSGCLEVEIIDLAAVDDRHTGFFRVGGID